MPGGRIELGFFQFERERERERERRPPLSLVHSTTDTWIHAMRETDRQTEHVSRLASEQSL